MSHVAFNGLPGYHKLLCSTDAVMLTHPDLQQKAGILRNAINVYRKLGVASPKVACLCCKETPDEKLAETREARLLRDMCERGEFGSCFVEGPISYDIAMSPQIAADKGFDCPHCGDFDILLFPDINSGNIFVKCLALNCGAPMAGIIAGARVPIAVSSRGALPEEKYYSLALASAISRKDSDYDSLSH